MKATRNASPQAWRRLRKHLTDEEMRDIARDIAAEIASGHDNITPGTVVTDIDWALRFVNWDSRKQV